MRKSKGSRTAAATAEPSSISMGDWRKALQSPNFCPSCARKDVASKVAFLVPVLSPAFGVGAGKAAGLSESHFAAFACFVHPSRRLTLSLAPSSSPTAERKLSLASMAVFTISAVDLFSNWTKIVSSRALLFRNWLTAWFWASCAFFRRGARSSGLMF